MLAQGLLYGCIFLALVAPLVAAIIVSLTFATKKPINIYEKITYRLVRFFYVFGLCASFLGLIAWFFADLTFGSIYLGQIPLMKNFIISLRLVFDLQGVIFLATCNLITAVITFFSHRYLHRDPGYRRFFITISIFSFGIYLIILAGTFDLIFMGWEIVGFSSFLLIAYFWHRPKAVGAATRAYYIYRITDLGLLTSLLITHFFWHDVNVFADFYNTNDQSILYHVPHAWRWLLSMCILLPVLGKSAQFPFCFWLPKAMEGPTHSSAIFYGSLSIHVGIFLLLRTRPIWFYTPGFTYLLLVLGLITAILATLFALVQSNIKGQIGYASIAQVGLMLIELSLGFYNLVFIHMIGNAFLRCFQLLVSGSILTTHLHMQNVVRTFGQFYSFSLPNLLPKSMQPSIFAFALNDGFLEFALKRLFVRPIMFLSNACNHILMGNLKSLFHNRHRLTKSPFSPRANSTLRSFSPIFFLLFLGVLIDLMLHSFELVRIVSLILALVLILASLGEAKKPINALLLVILGNVFAFLSLLNSESGMLYFLGLLVSSLVALENLHFIKSRRSIESLKAHHGLFQQFPLAGAVLLVSMMGIVSFPFSSTFYGEDLLLELSVESGLHYLIMFQIIFMLSGISMVRLYALLMFGQRDNAMSEINLDFKPLWAFFRIMLLFLGNALAFILVTN